jgi:hypothetical protein
MRRWKLWFIAAVTVIVIAAAVSIVLGQRQLVSFSPDHILKGTAPIITITLDKSIQGVKSVRVGGQDAAVQQPSSEGELSVQLPKLDIVGSADVEIIGKDDKPVALGQLTYVQPPKPPLMPALGSSKLLLLLYVGLIVFLPISCTLYDIHKSYAERHVVLKQVRPHATNEEIKTLLKDMDQGPTGLTGLTRGLIALTLILVLAIAAFHLVVFAPKVPDIADKLLMILAGTLTAITGFYFGSKAATEGATEGAAAASKAPPSSGQVPVAGVPKISKVDPTHGAPNTAVSVIGEGFGDSKGTGSVMVGDKNASVTKWSDKKIEVTIAPDAQTGAVNVVVTNDNGNPSQPYSYTITGSTAQQTVSTVLPKISNVDPPGGGPNAPITVTGEGFGEAQGKG